MDVLFSRGFHAARWLESWQRDREHTGDGLQVLLCEEDIWRVGAVVTVARAATMLGHARHAVKGERT